MTPVYKRSPLQMSLLPSDPWKEVAMDLWGPISPGECLFVVTCKHSHWAEVEFVSSTSAQAVLIPKLDHVFSLLRTAVTVGFHSAMGLHSASTWASSMTPRHPKTPRPMQKQRSLSGCLRSSIAYAD